jgi:hypothetical protein
MVYFTAIKKAEAQVQAKEKEDNLRKAIETLLGNLF